MEAKFDFDKVGKRMPYTVPDGFFDELEENIRQEALKKPTKSRFGIVLRMVSAIAAMIAIVFILNINISVPSQANDMTDVAQAFNRLSDEDQAYLMDVYNNDVFLNEYEYDTDYTQQ